MKTNGHNVQHSPDTRPVFGYVRVSTDKQETERQEQTIPARHDALPDGLAANRLELFYDHGVSAWSGKPRPGFEEMYRRIVAGEASALLIDTSSRLTRQGIRHALSIFWTLQDANCRLFTTQGREYAFNAGDIISLILDAEGDERFSANASHNIATGKAAKAREGRWHHGDAPPGYRFDRDSGDLLATDDLPVVTEAFRRFNDAEPYQRICDYLTANLSEGALVRRKNSRAYVSRDRLRGMLANPLYAGMIPHRDELHQGTHPPAVDLPTFERTQRRLRKLATSQSREPRAWPFSGIAKCGYCRRSLRLHPVKNRYGTRYYYTRCSDERGCAKAHKSYTASALEANIVLSVASVAHALASILTDDPGYGIPHDDGPSLDATREALDAAKARVKKLGKLIATEALDDDDPDYLAALRERDSLHATFDRIASSARSYRDELAGLAARVLSLADLADEDESAEHIREETVTVIGKDEFEQTHTVRRNRDSRTPTLLQLLQGWRAADFERRREVIAQTLEAAYVLPGSVELHFRVGLPVPLITEVAISLHGRSDDTRELEAGSYGAPFDTAQTEIGSKARRL